MSKPRDGMEAVKSTWAMHCKTLIGGVATEAGVRCAHLACLRAERAMHAAHGETDAALALDCEIVWAIRDAARAGVVIA